MNASVPVTTARKSESTSVPYLTDAMPAQQRSPGSLRKLNRRNVDGGALHQHVQQLPCRSASCRDHDGNEGVDLSACYAPSVRLDTVLQPLGSVASAMLFDCQHPALKTWNSEKWRYEVHRSFAQRKRAAKPACRSLRLLQAVQRRRSSKACTAQRDWPDRTSLAVEFTSSA